MADQLFSSSLLNTPPPDVSKCIPYIAEGKMLIEKYVLPVVEERERARNILELAELLLQQLGTIAKTKRLGTLIAM